MKQEITITRKSRNIGWGYTYWTPEHPEGPTKPEHTGTVKTVLDAIEADRSYQVERSGGTYLASSWFVKFGQAWYPCKFDLDASDLVTSHKGPFGEVEYMTDEIIATIEINANAMPTRIAK